MDHYGWCIVFVFVGVVVVCVGELEVEMFLFLDGEEYVIVCCWDNKSSNKEGG